MNPIAPHADSGTPATIAELPKTADPPIARPGPLLDPTLAPRKTPVDLEHVIDGINGRLEDAFFDYDRSELRPDAFASLQHDTRLLLHTLTDFPQLKVTIEGHCDERGSAEYNLALGDRRATHAAEALRSLGLPNSETVSYGKESPQCMEAAENCWSRNRRVHLVVRQ